MNLVFYIPILFFSVFTWAESKWPTEMPQNCAKEISQHQDVRNGSVSSSQFIEVDKANCKVIDVGSGDSDGECEM